MTELEPTLGDLSAYSELISASDPVRSTKEVDPRTLDMDNFDQNSSHSSTKPRAKKVKLNVPHNTGTPSPSLPQNVIELESDSDDEVETRIVEPPKPLPFSPPSINLMSPSASTPPTSNSLAPAVVNMVLQNQHVMSQQYIQSILSLMLGPALNGSPRRLQVEFTVSFDKMKDVDKSSFEK